MKKILFATTALFLSAGVAAAEVSFGGLARFGYSYNDATESVSNASRLRLQWSVSTTTDAGIKLSARQRFQTEENATGSINGARFTVQTGGLTVHMGNIMGAVDSLPNLYLPTNSAGVGLEGNGWESIALNNANGWLSTSHSSAGAGASNAIEAIYTVGGLTAHAHSVRDTSSALGVSFTMGTVSLGAGAESFDNGNSEALLTAGVDMESYWAAVAVARTSVAGVDVDKAVVKGGTTLASGMNVYGFAATEDAGESLGLGLAQDLGGGASLEAGWTRNENEDNTISGGVFFSF